ncbi:DeoR family transcriptional regulator [Bradyrhizobium sp. NAS80.1]|uniref:DeoR family transcriptional regulator n=1 Tax=Bradyrhizobium sp. NAS80.1 TaxID=1680159 RepID=UPI001FD9048E|nr:DeoR family transcriptional regulator [Bradyrhizobium sp. NAS80.1]
MAELSSARRSETRAQRLLRLRRAVETGGALHLRGAAELLNVSEMTVRRDLAGSETALALLGGYVVNATSPTGIKYAFEQEIDQHTQDKRLACRSAAASITAGDTIFIDCGTTMQSLADCLPEDLPLSVICYSMNVAAIVTRRPMTQVMLMGGAVPPLIAILFLRGRPFLFAQARHQQGIHLCGRRASGARRELFQLPRDRCQAGRD